MTYRVRRQAWTGKLILQDYSSGEFADAVVGHMLDGIFELVAPDHLRKLEARVAMAEKNAAAQRKGRAAKKAAATTNQDHP